MFLWFFYLVWCAKFFLFRYIGVWMLSLLRFVVRLMCLLCRLSTKCVVLLVGFEVRVRLM